MKNKFKLLSPDTQVIASRLAWLLENGIPPKMHREGKKHFPTILGLFNSVLS